MNTRVSVIIPVYNEEKVINDCINSLSEQTFKELEIIIIDDGSTDKTPQILSGYKTNNLKCRILQQNHLGAGEARNLGAKNAIGQILVFVDADMIFDNKFIEMLTKPIRSGEVIGTFSKYEYVFNKNNIWSKCWNLNRNLPIDRMHNKNYPDSQPVFRAVLKKEFDRVGGFDAIGYIDDHTLSKKIGVEAVNAKGAIFYHRNPETLQEVYQQARWIGKSEYKNRKIKIEFLMKIVSFIRYSLPFSLLIGLYKTIRYQLWVFWLFKMIYDSAIEISLIKSFSNEQKYR